MPKKLVLHSALDARPELCVCRSRQQEQEQSTGNYPQHVTHDSNLHTRNVFASPGSLKLTRRGEGDVVNEERGGDKKTSWSRRASNALRSSSSTTNCQNWGMHTLPLKDSEFNGKISIGSVNLGPIQTGYFLIFAARRN